MGGGGGRGGSLPALCFPNYYRQKEKKSFLPQTFLSCCLTGPPPPYPDIKLSFFCSPDKGRQTNSSFPRKVRRKKKTFLFGGRSRSLASHYFRRYVGAGRACLKDYAEVRAWVSFQDYIFRDANVLSKATTNYLNCSKGFKYQCFDIFNYIFFPGR